jgi:hypothetical protein
MQQLSGAAYVIPQRRAPARETDQARYDYALHHLSRSRFARLWRDRTTGEVSGLRHISPQVGTCKWHIGTKIYYRFACPEAFSVERPQQEVWKMSQARAVYHPDLIVDYTWHLRQREPQNMRLKQLAIASWHVARELLIRYEQYCPCGLACEDESLHHLMTLQHV